MFLPHAPPGTSSPRGTALEELSGSRFSKRFMSSKGVPFVSRYSKSSQVVFVTGIRLENLRRSLLAFVSSVQSGHSEHKIDSTALL